MKIQLLNPDLNLALPTNTGDSANANPLPENGDFFDVISNLSTGPSLQLSTEQVDIDLDLQTDVETLDQQQGTEQDQQQDQLGMQFQQQMLFNPNYSFDKTNSHLQNEVASGLANELATDGVETTALSNQTAKSYTASNANQRLTNTMTPLHATDATNQPANTDAALVIPMQSNNQNKEDNAGNKEAERQAQAFIDAANNLSQNQSLNQAQDKQIQAAALAAYSPVKEQLIDTQNDSQDKYVSALKQLGEFINSHTTQTLNRESATLNEANLAQSAYSKTANSLTRPDSEVKIDILPPSGDALMKDTYNANIRVFPPELGRVVVKLKFEKNNAELSIVAENNHIKEIIQTNLPQLRENFHKQDINLTNINVDVQTSQTGGSEQGQQGQNRQAQGTSGNAQQTNDFNNLFEQMPEKQSSPRNVDSIIDTYA